jgi:hypothetical protein
MLYPIKVLRNKVNQIASELDRINNLEINKVPGDEMKITIRKLNKRQKDLIDAINHLNKISTIDEIGFPKDDIKAKKE